MCYLLTVAVCDTQHFFQKASVANKPYISCFEYYSLIYIVMIYIIEVFNPVHDLTSANKNPKL